MVPTNETSNPKSKQNQFVSFSLLQQQENNLNTIFKQYMSQTDVQTKYNINYKKLSCVLSSSTIIILKGSTHVCG